MKILQILDEIALTSSTKEKEAILLREKDNITLRAVFAAAYEPLINYNIRKIPEYNNIGICKVYSCIGALDSLINREVTGNDAISYLKNILENCCDPIVIERIIQRDLRCGCSDTIASRIWPNLVTSFDVMLCDSDIKRIKYPALINLKMDGSRVHCYFDGTSLKVMSRAGKEFHLKGFLDETAKKFMKVGECFDGELLVMKDGKVVERKVANGILNKASKNTISEEEANSVSVVFWDIVDFTGTKRLQDRFNDLTSRSLFGKFTIVPWKIVENEEDAMAFFSEQLAAGEEGAVLKNLDSMWIGKRTKDLCKLKAIETCDLIVVDTFEGSGKYVGMLGGLVCETSDGKLQVNVGGGFSDDLRKLPMQYWNGKIVEVLYNQKITSKSKDKASLFLPRFLCERFDKTIPNSFTEIV